MNFYSTQGKAPKASWKEAVFKGLPEDRGLYMPESVPLLPKSFFDRLPKLSLAEIAQEVSQNLLGPVLPEAKFKALCEEVFDFLVPIVALEDQIHALELFHGPTLAFKDFGARFMARMMAALSEQSQQEITILVATSGDTGGAVAQGFLNVPGIKVVILYPSGQVSALQEKQLTTHGANIEALEVEGNFDDCQAMVKAAFLDPELNQGLQLSSANSINISRLLPQSFYYFYAWAQVKNQVFCTPSGNFGNLCGGLLAWKMGLPIRHFIAATNANKVVPDYLKSGEFHAMDSIRTIANAMDVGNPSNFPRLMDFMNHDHEEIKKWMSGYVMDDQEIKACMQRVWKEKNYLLCPHSAIGYQALKDYPLKKDEKGVFLATAHPAKFIDVVEPAIGEKIRLPEALEEVMKKKKSSTKISADFDALKAYLTA